MSPICLLTKGRSSKDTASRPDAYKVLAKCNEPKFGHRVKPSAPAAPDPEAPAQMSLSAPAKPEEAAPAPAPVVEQAAAEPVAPDAPVAAVEPAAPPVAEPVPEPAPELSKSPFAPGAKRSPRLTFRDFCKRPYRFCKRLVQRFVFGRKGRRIQKPSVQTELALDKVTVMRNDLNEDDLEVVLVQREVGRGDKPLARLSRMDVPAEAWNRLTAPFRKKGGAASPKAETKPSPELGARA